METQEKDNHVKDNIESLFEKAGDYIETRADLFKLRAVDKSTEILSALISKIIVAFVFVIFLFIVNFGIAFWLGELLGKTYYGFFALAGLYLITGLIFHYNRKKWFKEPLVNSFIRKFLK